MDILSERAQLKNLDQLHYGVPQPESGINRTVESKSEKWEIYLILFD